MAEHEPTLAEKVAGLIREKSQGEARVSWDTLHALGPVELYAFQSALRDVETDPRVEFRLAQNDRDGLLLRWWRQ